MEVTLVLIANDGYHEKRVVTVEDDRIWVDAEVAEVTLVTSIDSKSETGSKK